MRILGRLNSACSYAVVATALLAAGLGPAEARDVRNGQELQDALRLAMPGEVIRLLSGPYQAPGGAFTLRYSANDTPANNVDVVAAVPGGAVITSPLTVAGRYALLKDLRFEGGNIQVTIAADGVRVTDSVFKLTGSGGGRAIFVETGAGVRIERNEIVSRAYGIGVTAAPDGASDPTPTDLRICRNWFHDFTNGGGDPNQHSAVSLGEGSNDRLVPLGALVYENLFENVRVEGETVSVKSSNNSVNRNRVLASKNLVIRHGKYNTVGGNKFEGSGAIVIHDRYNKAVNNRATNSDGIRAMAGDDEYQDTGNNEGHRPAVDADIAGNIVGRIIDGYKPSGNSYDQPALRTCIASFDRDRNTVTRPFGEGSGGTCSAPTAPTPISTLGAGDVGPGSGSGCP